MPWRRVRVLILESRTRSGCLLAQVVFKRLRSWQTRIIDAFILVQRESCRDASYTLFRPHHNEQLVFQDYFVESLRQRSMTSFSRVAEVQGRPSQNRWYPGNSQGHDLISIIHTMRRRITFIHRREHSPDPNDLVISKDELHIQNLRASREDRITLTLYELPQEVSAAAVSLDHPC